MLSRRLRFTPFLFAFAVCLTGRALTADEASDELFEKQIRPLLIAKCGECHTGAQTSGGLRIESRADLLKGGDSGKAIDLEHPEKSLLLTAVRRMGELEMPPEDSLNKREIAALESWIKLKAPWPASSGKVLSPAAERARTHWAFQPVQRPEIPDDLQVRNPIDAFVLSRLEHAELSPAPEADKRTLIRRVCYTLTGLPPSPEQVAQFVTSNDEYAYEKLIDELLESPQYGEHWARHWLDVARYSDTKGYVYAREERFWVHAWSYRDWVVRALNEDMPYDQFLRLQIAADQVDEKRQSDQAAMGFLTLGRRFLGVPWEIIDDRIDTLCRGTMGLTVACARCHDHKYDPIPTADYYSLYGVFASSEEQLVRLEEIDEHQSFAAELQKRKQTLEEKLNAFRTESSQRARARIKDYLHAQTELEKYPAQGFDQIFSKEDLLPAFVRRWQYFLHQAKLNDDRIFVAWRMYQAIPEEEFAAKTVAVTNQINALSDDKINPLVLSIFSEPPKSFNDMADRYTGLFEEIDTKWQSTVKDVSESEKRPNALPDEHEEELRSVLYGSTAPCEVPDQPVVHTETFFDSGSLTQLWKLQGEVDRWIINAEQAVPFSVILVDQELPIAPRILRRGNPVNYGDDVSRQFLSLFSTEDSQPFQHGSGRRELADAIANAENPLTARVMINRVWMHHFGAGLVTTPSDFGLRAIAPSHPELLDWLATEFVENDWSLKKIHRLMLTSSTYRQASTPPVDEAKRQLAEQSDPENRLLWKMNQHRLSFEEFRDSLLEVTGDLDLKMGGKPSKIFAAPYPTRRTLYGLIDRQFLPSTLRVFDFANPDLHIPRRSETTVPQQSLFLMNHPLVLERVRALVEVVQRDRTDPQHTIIAMFRLAFQRDPSRGELAEALAFVEVAMTPDQPAIAPTVADWQYGYGAFDESHKKTSGFTRLPHFNGQAWQGGSNWPDAKLGWVQLTAEGGHPGNTREHACVRRWTAPRDLTLRLSSTLLNPSAAGDGIRAFIVSSNTGLLQQVKNHQQPTELNVETISVNQGETLDFIVDIDQKLNSDQFQWKITLEEIEGDTRWNSEDDFPHDTINQLTVWEQLAQALLCTNEFMFID
ncbi:PSD1 and planctomycete cytochrome C domain-containing protein [Planctomycetaceae bacterium]|nr:PSD1 and planctomycete cytochrome C domain-containing protein [Planctomycetaceae bacterium]